jgi:hypothetical protein
MSIGIAAASTIFHSLATIVRGCVKEELEIGIWAVERQSAKGDPIDKCLGANVERRTSHYKRFLTLASKGPYMSLTITPSQ